jgi:hypothetical protein
MQVFCISAFVDLPFRLEDTFVVRYGTRSTCVWCLLTFTRVFMETLSQLVGVSAFICIVASHAVRMCGVHPKVCVHWS